MPILGIYASSMQPALNATSFESIATVTVGAGGQANATFTSIPQTYKHLQIRGIARRTGTATASSSDWLRFNSDSGSNYTWHYLLGSGSAAVSGSGSNPMTKTYPFSFAGGGQASGIMGAFVVDILDYTNTNKYKTIRSLHGIDSNDANGNARFYSGSWMSNSAVTDITIGVDADTIAQYSSFALYGVKG